jgi:hypothetical protein
LSRNTGEPTDFRSGGVFFPLFAAARVEASMAACMRERTLVTWWNSTAASAATLRGSITTAPMTAMPPRRSLRKPVEAPFRRNVRLKKPRTPKALLSERRRRPPAMEPKDEKRVSG